MRLRLSALIAHMFVGVLGLLLLLLPFHAFMSTWGGSAAGPLLVWKSWKEILLLAIVPLVMVFLVFRPEVFKVLWARWVNRLLAVYLVIHLLWAFLSPASSAAVMAGLVFNLRFLAVFLLAQIVVASGIPFVHKLKQLLAPWLLVVTIVLAVMAVAQVFFLPPEFLAMFGYNKQLTIAPYILLDSNQDALRAFATLRGPNDFGSYLLLPLMLALALVIDQKRNILAGAALGLGVFALVLTGSRSAWLGAVAALVVLGVLWLPTKKLIKWAALSAVPCIVLGAVFLWLATTVPVLRLAVFHSSPGDSSLFEGSSEKHWQATYEGAQDAVAHPLGQGVGTAGPASYYDDSTAKIAENYYVQIAQEVGIPGLLTFLAINILLVIQLWRQRDQLWPKLLLASFVGLTVINLFLHGWVDDPTAMTWWLVAGLYAFAPHNHKSSNIKSRK